MAGHRYLETAAQGLAVNRHHHRFGRIFNRPQEREEGQARPLVGRHLLKFPDVGACNKCRTGADHDDSLDCRVPHRLRDRIEDAIGYSGAERIHGWIVDGNYRDVIQTRRLHQFVHSSLPRRLKVYSRTH